MVNPIRSGDGTLRLVSWNVKGVNSAIKSSKILMHLRDLKADVIFYKKLICERQTYPALRGHGWVTSFTQNFPRELVGAAIIIHKRVMFELAETIIDSNGRFVMVLGKLQNIPVILASIYAPNWDNDEFFVNFFSRLPKVDEHHIIIGGDFNLVQDVSLDRSSSKQSTLTKSANVLLNHASQLGLADPWRFKNPQGKAFSFFSHVHHTFSRIDFFWLIIHCCTVLPHALTTH